MEHQDLLKQTTLDTDKGPVTMEQNEANLSSFLV